MKRQHEDELAVAKTEHASPGRTIHFIYGTRPHYDMDLFSL